MDFPGHLDLPVCLALAGAVIFSPNHSPGWLDLRVPEVERFQNFSHGVLNRSVDHITQHTTLHDGPVGTNRKG